MPTAANPRDVEVLLVEDNEGLASSLVIFLTDQGIDVATVKSTDAAVAWVGAAKVRLALVSTGVSGGGPTACERLTADIFPPPRVLLLSTTRPTARALKEASEVGAEGIVQKMGGPRSILDRIRRLLPGVGVDRRPPSSGASKTPRPVGEGSLRRPAPHPHPVRAARQLPRGVQVQGRIKPKIASALSELKRRKAPDDEWAAGRNTAAGSGDLLSDDPLFAAGPTGGGAGPYSRADEEHRKGLAHFKAQEYKDARQRFANAWSLEPSTAIYLAYKIRCEALLASSPLDPDGDPGDDLKMAAMLNPKLVEPLLFLGYLFVDAGRPEDARKHFKAVLDLEPGQAEAKAALGKIVNEA